MRHKIISLLASLALIGLLFYFGASQFAISRFLQQYGEKILGPMLIVISLFMLGLIKLNLNLIGGLSQKFEAKKQLNYWGILLLGIIFALAFCPYSGVLYFGMLIPITISSASGLLLPLIFAIGTGIPVIIFAWLLAFSMKKVGIVFNRLQKFELWFRRLVGGLFLGVGIYYTVYIFI